MKPKTAASTQFAFSSRIRPSAFYEATMRWGCSAISVYNHFYMPSAFESLEADYNYLTTGVTLWDVAGERQTQIKGKDAGKFVQRLTPRDLSTCTAGKCRYILMTDKDGGVINDPVLLRVEEDTYWLSAADSDIHLWCRGIALHSDDDVEITTPDISPLQLQGPLAADVAEAAFGSWVREMKYFHLRQFEFEGIPLVISRTGWSGEFGYELYLQDGERGDHLWERIMEIGKPFGIRPAAPNAIRRIEAGLISYGADANMQDTPYHLNLGRLVNLDGDFDFIGKEALRKVQAEGVSRRLVGIVIEGEPLSAGLVRWWDIFASDDSSSDRAARIGRVRSAAYSHNLQQNIALAMVDKPHDADGSVLRIRTEHGETRTARVVPLPFVSPKTR